MAETRMKRGMARLLRWRRRLGKRGVAGKRPAIDENRVRWPHVASVLVMLVAALVFALLADWAPSAVSQAGLAALSLALLLVAAALTLPAMLRHSFFRHWAPWHTQIRFTAAGLPFLAALLILIIAAVNSGNNLVYLVVAALLGALVTSGIFSAFNLSGLSLDLRWPEQAFAGQPAPVQLTLENEKHWLPSYSLTLSASSLPVTGPAKERRGRGNQPVVMRTAYFPYLPGCRQATAITEITFPRRGLYSAASFILATRFPFGLIDKRRPFRPVEGSAGLVVYPRVTSEGNLGDLLADWDTQLTQLRLGQGQDLYRVRPHESGDGLRHVHWKASAKAGALRTREFSREQGRWLRIVFALAPGQATPAQLERTIELCASLVWALARTDAWLEFLGCNPAPDPAREDGGAEGLGMPAMAASQAVHAILRYLAVVDVTAAPRPWPPEVGVPHRLFLSQRTADQPVGEGAEAVYACELEAT